MSDKDKVETLPAKAKSLEETKQVDNILLRGTLRKKGLIFMNERIVTIDSKGILRYYHFDKPGIVKGSIDLTSS